MEETIQNLVTLKIREALILCGVNDAVNDPLKEHIVRISDLVHKARIEAGIQRPVDSTTLRGLGTRGSYRVLWNAEKQGRICFKEKAGTQGRKRRGKKNSQNNMTGKCFLSKDNQEGGSTEPLGQAGDQLSGTSTDHASLQVSPTMTGDIDLSSTNQLTMEGPCVLTGSEAFLAANLLGSNPAIKVMASILWDCVRLNLTVGKYGRQTQSIGASTEIKRIRQYADDIRNLEYSKAVSTIKTDNALLAGRDIQARYSETIFWEVIQKGAKLLDTTKMRPAMGPSDGFSVAEKEATIRFMKEAGYGTSRENQRLYRNLWKSLSEMREAGVEKILLYRTKEFDSYCKVYPKAAEKSLCDLVKSWEMVYKTHIDHLENQAITWSQGDFTGRSWLQQPHVAKQLVVPELSWNDAVNEWSSRDEAVAFSSITEQSLGAPSADHLWDLSDNRSILESTRNKSIFVTILPKENGSLSICSIIPVDEGDFLGIFAGAIRYSGDFSPIYGIRGPTDNLWLDYSNTTGTLNLMQVSRPGDRANVRIYWEYCREPDGIESLVSWRAAVRAAKRIKPFEEIIRAAAQKEQYIHHRSAASAKRGFLKKRLF
ncbi:hypothetical protein BJX63DRAFT_133904 [Aspergillus granulosus]|uniref:Uncharacterized protein n=1 Tax=Aspergillus granulosus TaxID=176169 RepID=A0ABR4GSS9_9EURO